MKIGMITLSKNLLGDLSPLSGLSNLTYLYLEVCEISDISPLSNLTNLLELNLSRNYVVNLGPLSNLSKLERLWLSYASDLPDE